ncbi:MAG TPA: hypothetical protein VGV59_05880 [Pyrinomonadaceae bacterium]|nr:hypothetical protein [Pyrinomonadaceae bacterium]
MNQSNKKGFAALYDLQERKKQAKTESPPLPTTPHDSPPLPTTPQTSLPVAEEVRPSPAPARDFNRRANSLERDAMPQGLFPGSSKKIYDALYLRSRGAHPPRARVRASRRDFLDWTDIRNLKTVDGHLRYLMGAGLIIRHWELGSTEGSEYEVRLPEELPRLTTTHHHSPADTTTQLSGSGNPQFSGSGGYSQTIDLKDTSDDDKTFKTNTERNDDEALADFVFALKKAAKEVTGRESTGAEKQRWAELADVLITELKIAAGRTTVSSAPSFLAEHLRRRLWKKEKRQIEADGAHTPPSPLVQNLDATQCPDCYGTGMWYPEGYDKGVARCRHEKLSPKEAP